MLGLGAKRNRTESTREYVRNSHKAKRFVDCSLSAADKESAMRIAQNYAKGEFIADGLSDEGYPKYRVDGRDGAFLIDNGKELILDMGVPTKGKSFFSNETYLYGEKEERFLVTYA